MKNLAAKLTEALGLDAGADEEAITKAVTDLKQERDTAITERDDARKDTGDKTTLEDRAKAEGKIVIDADDYKSLGDRLTKAEQDLTDTAFDTVFDKALGDGRVDNKEETRDRYRRLFDQDRDTTVELLEAAPKLVSTSPKGAGGSKEVDAADTDVDPDSEAGTKALDKKVRAYMREHNITVYTEALEAVTADSEEED